MNITQLPFAPFKRKTVIKEYTLPEDLFVSAENSYASWRIPKGTIVKLITSANFGYVITPDLGNARRLFRY